MLLQEALFNEESRAYSEAQMYLHPLVSDVEMALNAISNCNIQELQTILTVAEKFHSNVKYSEEYNKIREKLKKVLNFLESFNKRFSEAINESILETPEKIASSISGNIIQMIIQDHQLGFEESLVILNSLRPIVGKLSTGADRLMANIYFAGLNVCERYDIFGKQFAIVISSNDNWSIDQFIRGYVPRLDNIVCRGLSLILCSKDEIRRLDNSSKKDIKLAYKALVEKGYKFSLVERYRALFL